MIVCALIKILLVITESLSFWIKADSSVPCSALFNRASSTHVLLLKISKLCAGYFISPSLQLQLKRVKDMPLVSMSDKVFLKSDFENGEILVVSFILLNYRC